MNERMLAEIVFNTLLTIPLFERKKIIAISPTDAHTSSAIGITILLHITLKRHLTPFLLLTITLYHRSMMKSNVKQRTERVILARFSFGPKPKATRPHAGLTRIKTLSIFRILLRNLLSPGRSLILSLFLVIVHISGGRSVYYHTLTDRSALSFFIL